MIKHFLIILMAILSSSARAQSNARVFTYDAAGNRITMGIPQAQAPRKLTDGMESMEMPMTITALPDGRVRMQMKTGGTTYSARVYSTSGKLVAILQPTSKPVSILDLSSLQANVYLIDIAFGDRHVVQKIAIE